MRQSHGGGHNASSNYGPAEPQLEDLEGWAGSRCCVRVAGRKGLN